MMNHNDGVVMVSCYAVIQHPTNYAIVVEVSQFGSCYIAIYHVMNLITLCCEMEFTFDLPTLT